MITARRRRAAGATGLLLLALVVTPATAHAYLDPASGSLIVQVLIASILGIIVGFKRIWFAITEFFRKLFRRRS